MDLKILFENIENYIDKDVVLTGWIRNHRKQKDFGFIDFSDGTCFGTIQLVYDNSLEILKIDAEHMALKKFLLEIIIAYTSDIKKSKTVKKTLKSALK